MKTYVNLARYFFEGFRNFWIDVGYKCDGC